MSLVTLAEADDFLPCELFPEWGTLTPKQKVEHLENASAYVQVTWNCTDVIWSDVTTLTESHKKMVSKYADMDGQGKLYPSSASGADSNAPTKKKTLKLSGLEKTIEYAQMDDSGTFNNLINLENQMIIIGCSLAVESGGLVRT